MASVFVTGATGYIGGDALFAIAKARPDLQLTCLVRSSSKGALIAAEHPSIRLVYGDLDNHELLVEEASKADVVLNCANIDHEPCIASLVEGLSKKQKTGYIIHTSGGGNLSIDDMQKGMYGKAPEKIYDDWDGIEEVTHLPDEAPHRHVDKLVLAANAESSGKVNTAIICPPTIYGPGRGPGNKKSDQIYELAKAILKRGKGFTVGDGKNIWSCIHVQDLSDLYLSLVEAAVTGEGSATWNDKGYYFAADADFEWGDVARGLVREGVKQGYLKTEDLDKLNMKEADQQIEGFPGGALWGLNGICKAIRARKLLNWQPSRDPVEKFLASIVELEAKEVGLWKGHATKAAGDA